MCANHRRPGRTAGSLLFSHLLVLLTVMVCAGCMSPPGPPPNFPLKSEPWRTDRVHPEATVEDRRYIEMNWLHDVTEDDRAVAGRDGQPTEKQPSGGKQAGQDARPQKLTLTLEQAINYAIEHNRDLRNSLDSAKVSHYSLVIAKSAFEVKVKPNGSIELDRDGLSHEYGVEVSKKLSPGTVVTTEAQQDRVLQDYGTDVEVSIEQPLLRGFGREVNLNRVITARRGVESRLRSFELRKETVVLSVARSYYEVMRQRAVVVLNEQSAARVRRLLEMSRARQQIGLTTKLDVLRAEIQLAQALDALESARKGLQDAEDDLKLLLALNPEAELNLIGKIYYVVPQVHEKEAIAVAMRNRLDLFEAHDRIEDARRLIRVARNEVLPDLDVNLNYRWSGAGDNVGSSTNLTDSAWTVGVSTSTDLWRTSERATLEQRRIDLGIQRRDYRGLRDDVVQEVRQQLRQLKESKARIDIQMKNMAQAQTKLQLARLQFVKGLANNFDVIDAEQDLINAESRYIRVVTDFILTEFELRRAMGTLTEKPEFLKS